MKRFFFTVLLFAAFTVTAQNKKAIDHTVYDGWKSIGERMISNDGKFVVYGVNPQEGDGELVVQNAQTKYKKIVARGYSAVITEDSKYVVFKIKPFFQDTRQAKIKKKTGDDLPKDSLAIMELGQDSILKIAKVKSYKTPEKAAGFMAYLMEKTETLATTKVKALPDSVTQLKNLLQMADSLIKVADSLRQKTKEAQSKGLAVLYPAKKETKPAAPKTDTDKVEEGTDLILRNLNTGIDKKFKLVTEYFFSKKANTLIVETSAKNTDSLIKATVLLVDLATGKTDTIFKKFNDAKNYELSEDGYQLAFVAERDSVAKALTKFYKLYYYKHGADSATVIADKNTPGMQLGSTISESANLVFSKDGQKLFFGTAAVKAPKDTMLVDFELAKLDVWHYNDDYLQPQQLKQLDAELKRSYTAVIVPGQNKIVQLGNSDVERIALVDEGNADYVLGITTKGNRKEAQWTGRTKQTGYIINTTDGNKKLITKDEDVFMQASPKGKYVGWYNPKLKHYFTYEVATGTVKNVTAKITVPLYDTENDVPDYPSAVGITGWTANDEFMLINDEYDIWQVSPNGSSAAKNITNGYGRKNKTTFEYVQLDNEKRFIDATETILLRSFNKASKYAGFATKKIDVVSNPDVIVTAANSFNGLLKAKNAAACIVQKASIEKSELYTTENLKDLTQLTDVASQQKEYNWLTAELVKWKMFDGKMSEGVLYKPENFDPNKKYPVIFYFYERDADGLYGYRAPAPSASTVNVPYFASNGYLIFDPNIYYRNGEPGQSAYNSVVSAAKYLSKMPWVDSTRMAIQGQSWGGYQVAYLVTKTNMFRAAGAGAPVANMTSAYGGIRWGSGLNRQFQYEHTQSRIGATLWQRPDLYIKNSPLFSVDKITTPLLLMHNDADGAVPWYQGIEMFTAMRRLNKKVWLLQYNAEDHNLVERRNRKDLSVRLAQFFDYWLKDAKPAKWITDGVPAVDKGRDWGLKVE